MNYKVLKGSEFFPKSGNQPTSAMILLHGVGANGENMMPLATYFSEILPDCYFFSPNGFEKYDMVSMFDFGPSFQWFSLKDRSYPRMKAGVENAAEYVCGLIDEISERFKISHKKIILLGFSQGAMTALHAALTSEKQIAGVLSFSGALVVSNPAELNIKSKPKVCLVHGINDDVVPYDRSLVANQKLKEFGIDTEFHSLAGLTHSIDYNGIEIGKKFIKKLF